LASSETSRVITETMVGWPCGDSSKHSLALCRSSNQITNTPASYVDRKSTLTRASNWKSPSGTGTRARGAVAVTALVCGSTNTSVLGPASTVTAPSSPTATSTGGTAQFSGESNPRTKMSIARP
jgi:hypothetical protein